MARNGVETSLNDINQRNESSWNANVDKWQDEFWQELTTTLTLHWTPFRHTSITWEDLKDQLQLLILELRRISGEVLPDQQRRKNRIFSWQANWLLLCASVDVFVVGPELPDNLGQGIDFEILATLLNCSPLFEDWSEVEVELLIDQLALLLLPPESPESDTTGKDRQNLTVHPPRAKRPSPEPPRPSDRKRQAGRR